MRRPAIDSHAGARQKGGLPHFSRNTAGRDFAVGDIHGCFSHLSRSLQAIGFDASVDRLFSVGDLVDRGPESDQVLEWLALPWFHAICGNHDFMTWRSALGIPCRDAAHLANGGGWLAKISGTQRSQLGRTLRALPLALEVETSSGLVGPGLRRLPVRRLARYAGRPLGHGSRRAPWASAACGPGLRFCN